MIRTFDLIFSFVGLILLLPFFIIIWIWIKLDSKGPVFYKQSRVGRFNKDFKLYKFRSMRVNADKSGLLTVGAKDHRITKAGYYLRKFKIDEWPQLINVLKGEMSLVGPRPEVRKYVDHYTDEQRRILNVRPGITDNASIEYRNENEILSAVKDPERVYLDEILPHKIALNRTFIDHPTISNYFRIIFRTILFIFRKKST